jgi:hypothetical protein
MESSVGYVICRIPGLGMIGHSLLLGDRICKELLLDIDEQLAVCLGKEKQCGFVYHL